MKGVLICHLSIQLNMNNKNSDCRQRSASISRVRNLPCFKPWILHFRGSSLCVPPFLISLGQFFSTLVCLVFVWVVWNCLDHAVNALLMCNSYHTVTRLSVILVNTLSRAQVTPPPTKLVLCSLVRALSWITTSSLSGIRTGFLQAWVFPDLPWELMTCQIRTWGESFHTRLHSSDCAASCSLYPGGSLTWTKQSTLSSERVSVSVWLLEVSCWKLHKKRTPGDTILPGWDLMCENGPRV